jgi:PAS domain S-box-containing protein
MTRNPTPRSGGPAAPEWRLEDLFIQGPAVVFRWKAAEGWPVEYVSPNVREQFGHRPEDFLSGRLVFSTLVHPDDLARVAEEVRVNTAGGFASFRQAYRLRRADGQYRNVDDFTTVVRDSQGRATHYHGYLVDATERGQVEEALRESRARYEAIVDAFDGLIYICSQDLKVEFMNRRFIERTGRNPIGEDCYRALHDRDSICPWCVNDAVFRGQTVRWEVQSPKDNRWYYVVNTPLRHADGRLSKVAMIQDITERKQNEDAVHRRELILEAIAFASSEFMKHGTWEECIDAVLERYGLATGVSRVYIIQCRTDAQGVLLTTRRNGWQAEGIPSLLYHPELQDFPMRARGFGRWVDVLQRGEIIDGHTREFPESEQALLRGLNVKSILAVPIFVEAAWWGFLGMDSCDRERDWSPVAIDAVKVAARLIGCAIGHGQAVEALRESESRFATFMDHLPAAVYIKDENGRMVYVNRRLKELAGGADWTGKNACEVLPPDRAAAVGNHEKAALFEGPSRKIEHLFGGAEARRTYETWRFPIKRKGKPPLVGAIAADITDRMRAEDELHRLNRVVRALGGCNHALLRSKNEGDFLDAVCRIMVEKIGYRLAWIGYAEKDEAKTVRPVAQAGYEDGYLATLQITWHDTERGRGPTGTAIRTGKPSVCRNILTAPECAPWRAQANQRGFASLVALPLTADGEVIGALNLYAAEADAFDDAEVERLAELAHDIAHGISVLRVREERRRAEEALRASERRLSDIINFLPDPTFALDRDGRVIAWNLAMERLSGVAAPDILGKGNHECAIPFYGKRRPVLADLLLHPDEKIAGEYAQIEKQGERVMAEVFFPTFRAGGMHARLVASPLYDAQGHVAGAIESVRDITARKRADEAIRKLSAFPLGNPNPILEFDREGRILYFNPSAKRLASELGVAEPIRLAPADWLNIGAACLASRESRTNVEVEIAGRVLTWFFVPIPETASVHAYGVDITPDLKRRGAKKTEN